MKYRRLRVPGGCYFFTVVTHNRQPLFADQRCVELLNESVSSVRNRHPFTVDAYVVLPDHLHMVWSLPDGDDDFSTRWMLIKGSFARVWSRRFSASGLGRANGSTPSPWQHRFWEHLIAGDDDFSNHVEYIHYNPVHHGLSASPVDWPHSSFHDFVARGDYPADWGAGEAPKLNPIDRRSD